ncbi:MAG: tRNA (adenosine(37)-N6)-threonylcarbamoyltransferase complex ATPase subunit type 1 TsaE [Nitrospinota bacterium]
MKADTLILESRSPAKTEAIGRDLAKNLTAGDAILLYGDLGAGKSVLARGIIQALPGGENRTVPSPTYVYIRHHPTRPQVHHLDLYRLPKNFDPQDLGLEELIDSESVTIVEWAERLEEGLFPRFTRVRLEILNEDRRRIHIQKG